MEGAVTFLISSVTLRWAMVDPVPSTSWQRRAGEGSGLQAVSQGLGQRAHSQRAAARGTSGKSLRKKASRESRAAQKDAERHQQTLEKKLGIAGRAGSAQTLGEIPAGGAEASHPPVNQTLNSPLDPCISQPGYSSWSPDGSRERLSTIQVEPRDIFLQI